MKQVIVLFVLIMVALIAVAGTGRDTTDDVAVGPLSGIRERMKSAYNKGTTLFEYRHDVPSVALCNDRTWLADLGPGIREVELTSQEAANLTLCKLDPETGAYYKMQDVPDPQPGDYFLWKDGGLHGLRYK